MYSFENHLIQCDRNAWACIEHFHLQLKIFFKEKERLLTCYSYISGYEAKSAQLKFLNTGNISTMHLAGIEVGANHPSQVVSLHILYSDTYLESRHCMTKRTFGLNSDNVWASFYEMS